MVATIALYLPYGLAFFVLGLTALVTRRTRYTPIPLLAELRWLAGFGIIHGVAEWHTIYVQLDAFSSPYLGSWILLALNVVSFWCLLRFGTGLLVGYGWAPRALLGLLSLLGVMWSAALFGVAVLPAASEIHVRILDVLCRYTLGFPGSMATAAGLYSAAKAVKAFDISHRLRRALLVMVGCFIVYGLSNGFAVPDAAFRPASMLTTAAFHELTGFPIQILRALSASVVAVAFFLVGDDIRQSRERRMLRLRELALRTQERDRFGHDLHDSVIQKLFAAGLQLESAAEQGSGLRSGYRGEHEQDLVQARQLINEAIQSIRSFIAAPVQDPNALTPSEFLVLLADHSERLRRRFNVPIVLQTAAAERSTMIEMPNEWFAVLEEAVTNAVRHARKPHVQVSFRISSAEVCLTVTNSGKAINTATAQMGTGIKSMQERAKRLGGELMIQGLSNRNSTVLTLVVPL